MTVWIFTRAISLPLAATGPGFANLPDLERFLLPIAASVTARAVDPAFVALCWASAGCFASLVTVISYIVVRYRVSSRAANQCGTAVAEHGFALQVLVGLSPLPVLVPLFWQGFKGYLDLAVPPGDALEVVATASQSQWLFRHPGGLVSDALHVPVDQPVKLRVRSVDVLHGVYLPNFRVQAAAIPGRFTQLWFEATRVGDFPLFCSQYCGTMHSEHVSHVVVHTALEYERWLKDQRTDRNLTPVELGRQLYSTQGCSTCHSVDGSPRVGPTWKGLFGRSEVIAGDASPVRVDAAYLRESMIEPAAKVVQGFVPAMPSYAGKLQEAEIDALIAYIRSLQ